MYSFKEHTDFVRNVHTGATLAHKEELTNKFGSNSGSNRCDSDRCISIDASAEVFHEPSLWSLLAKFLLFLSDPKF